MSFFEFATMADCAYIRVHGQANNTNSHLFRDLVDVLLGRACRTFFVDLGACDMVDSTFMGVLYGITMYDEDEAPGSSAEIPAIADPSAEEEEQEQPKVMVLNAHDACSRALDGVGLGALITINAQAVEIPEGVEFERLQERTYDSDERIEMIIEAHKNLIEADARNEAIFGPFLATLNEEFLRLE